MIDMTDMTTDDVNAIVISRMYETLARYERLAERSRSRGLSRQSYLDEKNVKRIKRAIDNIEERQS